MFFTFGNGVGDADRLFDSDSRRFQQIEARLCASEFEDFSPARGAVVLVAHDLGLLRVRRLRFKDDPVFVDVEAKDRSVACRGANRVRSPERELARWNRLRRSDHVLVVVVDRGLHDRPARHRNLLLPFT